MKSVWEEWELWKKVLYTFTFYIEEEQWGKMQLIFPVLIFPASSVCHPISLQVFKCPQEISD